MYIHQAKNWAFMLYFFMLITFIFVKLIGIGSLNLDSFDNLFYPNPVKTINQFH